MTWTVARVTDEAVPPRQTAGSRPPLSMSRLAIPPALDRHLVSTAHAAATAGEAAVGAFEAAVEEVARALHSQGATRAVVERAFRDVFAGLSFAFERTPTADRYAALEQRAVVIVARHRERSRPRPSGGMEPTL